MTMQFKTKYWMEKSRWHFYIEGWEEEEGGSGWAISSLDDEPQGYATREEAEAVVMQIKAKEWRDG